MSLTTSRTAGLFAAKARSSAPLNSLGLSTRMAKQPIALNSLPFEQAQLFGDPEWCERSRQRSVTHSNRQQLRFDFVQTANNCNRS